MPGYPWVIQMKVAFTPSFGSRKIRDLIFQSVWTCSCFTMPASLRLIRMDACNYLGAIHCRLPWIRESNSHITAAKQRECLQLWGRYGLNLSKKRTKAAKKVMQNRQGFVAACPLCSLTLLQIKATGQASTKDDRECKGVWDVNHSGTKRSPLKLVFCVCVRAIVR